MRFRLEKAFIAAVVVLIIICYLSDKNEDSVNSPSQVSCYIEGARKIDCLREGSEVYLPFRFIQKQFDVNGKWVNDERFEYFTSYSKSKRPDIGNYSSFGAFGNFGSYNVEKRDRVGCISGKYQVPMSTQWHSTPYFYPIQIAQFGLQHYSRFLTESSPELHYIRPENIKSGRFVFLTKNNASYIKLEDPTDSIDIYLNDSHSFSALSFHWTPLNNNAFFSISVKADDNTFSTMNYVINNNARCSWSTNTGVYYHSLDIPVNRTLVVARDFYVDFMKARGRKGNTEQKMDLIKPLSLSFHGPSEISVPIVQSSSAHKQMFFHAASWLLDFQNEDGIWPVLVKRTFMDSKIILKPGWPSAMAQGHCISVLVRAYYLTKDGRYMNAARKALLPFRKLAKDGGVINEVFGMPWYEEYPSTPPTLVLNGFIYSLIGLYDLACIENGTAWDLFQAGLTSLSRILPLYDTGSGSTYDLRHLFLRTPPNLARWDYHKVHIYLLKWLNVITKDNMYFEYSERWLGYSMGKRAKHN